MIEKPYKKEKLEAVIKSIPELVELRQKQITLFYKLQFSCMRELNKMSDEFYLARKKKSEIRPIMIEHSKLYKLAFEKEAPWYHGGFRDSYMIEDFWVHEKGVWNKAHNLPYSNNMDLNQQSMEYKHS